MALLTAEQAATRLNRTERTVRRWINSGMLEATHPTHGRKDKFLIEESEVERLAQELAQEQPEQQQPAAASEDTSSLEQRVNQLEQELNSYRLLSGPDLLALGPEDMAHIENRLDALEQSFKDYQAQAEQRLAAIEQLLSVGVPTLATDRILRPERATYTTATTEPPTDIPAGSIPHYIFARDHDVPTRTFLEQIQKHKVEDISRVKPNKPRESEHWLTPEQQQAAIAFWTRNGTKFTRCSACPHNQDQQPASQDQPLQSDQVEVLPIGYVALRKFTDLHGIARNAVEPMRRAGFIAVERGKWKNEDGQEVTEALSPRGQRDLWIQFHSQDGFRPCDTCPHLPASPDQQAAEAMM